MARSKPAASEVGPQDNLEEIEGIGPEYAKALRRVGVRTFADLANYQAPVDLQQDLHDRASVEVALWKIENRNGTKGSWLHQARRLAKASKKVRPSTGLHKARRSDEWDEHASFMVFFESKTDDKGEQVWQTRTYKTENGDDKPFDGVEPTRWVAWILEHAQLPATLTPATRELETEAERSQADVRPEPLEPVRIDIVDVEVDVNLNSSILARELVAAVRFEVSGPEALSFVQERFSFLVEMWLIEDENRSRQQVAAIEGQLAPNRRVYLREASFEMPPIGRYELHTALLVRPPQAKLASHAGPVINIVAQSMSLKAAAEMYPAA